MRIALGLTMFAAGIISVYAAFQANPDPRVVIGDLFGVDTSGLTLINDPGPGFGPGPGVAITPLTPDEIAEVERRAPRPATRDPQELGSTRP